MRRRTADLVTVTYETRPAAIDTNDAMDTGDDPAAGFGEPLAATRGAPESAFQPAEVTHEAHDVTPTAHHRPMEPSASIVRGAGEIPMTGVAPASAKALSQATGNRLRARPITPDKRRS